MRTPPIPARCAALLRFAALVAALAAALLTLAACAPLPSTTPAGQGSAGAVATVVTVVAAPHPLIGSTWILTSLAGQPPLPGSHLTVTFAQSKFSGFGGCNHFGGRYGVEGNYVRPDTIQRTLEGCLGEGILEQERAYVDAVQAGGQFRLDGDRLEILDQAGQVKLAFMRQAEWPPQDVAALLGNTWRLMTVNGTAPLVGSTITLAFEAQGKNEDGTTTGRAFGSAGCRAYEAGFEADARRVWFPMLRMLGEVCVSSDLLLQEGEYTTMLGWLDRYRVDSETLELHTQRGEILRFARVPADATVAPAATPINGLPAICAAESPDTLLLVSPEAGYCLRYPVAFQPRFSDAPDRPAGTWGVSLLDPNDPNRTVSLYVQTSLANGRTLDQVVAKELSRNSNDIIAQVTQTPGQLGGEPAVILDGLPGILMNRQAFVIHGDRLHYFLLLPWHDQAFGDWQAEAQALWERVANSLAFIPTPDVASPAQDAGRIVFEARSATGEDLFSVKPDGTDLRQITRDPGLNQEPACSPDGQRIAFTSWRGNTHYLYLLNADGSQERQLAGGPGNVAEPAWSPDGRQIVFSSEADKAFYVINADGMGQERLPVTGDNLYAPAWSPDGQRLAYTSYARNSWDLHIARLDGSGDMNLTGGRAFYVHQAAWSPNGQQIAFYGTLGGGKTFEIYVMNADGSGVRRLTTAPDDDSWRNNGRPAWSPDGMQIAFHSDRGGGFDIWIMNADGSEQTQLTHGLNASNPCWLPGR